MSRSNQSLGLRQG